MDEDDAIITMVTHLIPDVENEDFDGQAPQPEAPDAPQQGVDWSQPQNTPVSFDLDATDHTNLPVIIEDEEYTLPVAKPRVSASWRSYAHSKQKGNVSASPQGDQIDYTNS